MFRGREITHPDLGWKILQRMAETLKEVGVLERQPLMEGRRMDIILAPAGAKPKVKAEPKAEVKTETKTAVKTEAKTAVKAEAKTAVKTEVKETQNAKT
jgi:translation initiation factor IF-3